MFINNNFRGERRLVLVMCLSDRFSSGLLTLCYVNQDAQHETASSLLPHQNDHNKMLMSSNSIQTTSLPTIYFPVGILSPSDFFVDSLLEWVLPILL